MIVDDVVNAVDTVRPRPAVYTASSISNDPFGNLGRLTKLFIKLQKDGKVVPCVPHFGAWANIMGVVDYELWMDLDFAWILRCDALLRVKGVSPGADREVRFAEANGIPVFYNLDDLYAWADEWTMPKRRRTRTKVVA